MASTDAAVPKAKTANPSSVYDFTVLDAKKKESDLAQYKGQPLLFMNVASQCGYTQKGYTAATELYSKYKDRGFTVLAFPCNQFGSQEPGSNEDIAAFACTRFKAEFPIMDKVDVNGKDASPVWDFLKKGQTGILGTESVKWNFTAFLVNAEGKPIKRYAPGASAAEIEKDLLTVLPKRE